MPKENTWNLLPMPLSGPLDTRSRPADLGPGVLRWKLNLAMNSSGKMCRRTGFQALSFGQRSDTPTAVANWDHHRQGATREPFTLLSEITSPDNVRYLFDGTGKRVSWMDNDTSEWHDIITNGTTGTRWRIASLRDKVVLVNNVDPPRIHTLGDTAAASVLDLSGAKGDNGKVIVAYEKVMVMMQGNLIQWSDYRDASSWNLAAPDTIANFKYLDDGEQILSAAELGGVLYIWTDRAIWRMFPNITTDTVFGWHRWYSEPKNRTACLKYENTVVATGKEFFYLGDQTVYWFNQFSSAPSSPDWLLKASGRMFEGPERLDADFCESPIGAFIPDSAGASKEVHFYYPRIGGDTGINDYGLVLSYNTDSQTSPYQTGDYLNHGFTAVTAFTHAAEGLDCKTLPTYIGASGVDYSLKSIGDVFYREMVTLMAGGVTEDIPDASYALSQQGYYSELMLLAPFGYDQREKILRTLTITHDTVAEDVPNLFRLRIGGSYILADPLSTAPNCGVLWRDIDDLPAACPDVETLDDLAGEGLRQDDSTNFEMQEQSRFIYAHLKIVGPDGEAPIGTDSAFANITFDYLLLN